MLPFIIIASVAGVAGAAIAKENQRRIDAGLPPLQPAKAEPKKPDRTGDVMLLIWILIGGVIFCAPWIAFIYAVVNFAFAKQGVEWP